MKTKIIPAIIIAAMCSHLVVATEQQGQRFREAVASETRRLQAAGMSQDEARAEANRYWSAVASKHPHTFFRATP